MILINHKFIWICCATKETQFEVETYDLITHAKQMVSFLNLAWTFPVSDQKSSHHIFQSEQDIAAITDGQFAQDIAHKKWWGVGNTGSPHITAVVHQMDCSGAVCCLLGKLQNQLHQRDLMQPQWPYAAEG